MGAIAKRSPAILRSIVALREVLRVSLRSRNRVLGAARKSNASPNVPISSRLMFYLLVVLPSVESVFEPKNGTKCDDNRYTIISLGSISLLKSNKWRISYGRIAVWMSFCSEFRHESFATNRETSEQKEGSSRGIGIEISRSSIRIVNGGQRWPRETKRTSIEWLSHCVPCDPP